MTMQCIQSASSELCNWVMGIGYWDRLSLVTDVTIIEIEIEIVFLTEN